LNAILDLFDNQGVGSRHASVCHTPISDKNYILAFTPRSGSTWLSELLGQTGALGTPQEWFSEEAVYYNAKHYHCDSVLNYVDTIRRITKTPNGVFGLKASYHHLKNMLELMTIEQLFGAQPVWFYLRRRNVIAQAISLFRSAASGYFHSFQNKQENREHYQRVEYDAEKILFWCNHILSHEQHMEELFREQRTEPVRLFYEEIVGDSLRWPLLFCNVMNVRLDALPSEPSSLPHRVGDEKNLEWERRFCWEHPSFVDDVAQRRTAFMELPREA
jgi:trehalose 2-sulfotransferase